jgi:hypothetical protein
MRREVGNKRMNLAELIQRFLCPWYRPRAKM